MLRQLEENALDLGLVTLPAPGRMFDVSPLLEDEFVVLSSTEGTVLPRTVTAEVLMRHPIVLYEPGAQTRRIVDDWFAASGLAIKPTMELGSVELVWKQVSQRHDTSAAGVHQIRRVFRSAPTAAEQADADGGIRVRAMHQCGLDEHGRGGGRRNTHERAPVDFQIA